MQTLISMQDAQLKELQEIPGVGPSIARDLMSIGITSVEDLKGQDPEKLYDVSNRAAGVVQDRCLLYVFRCAVYFASTRKPAPEKLQWWYWKDKTLTNTKRRRRTGKSTIGDRVRTARRNKKFDQTTLAEKVGIVTRTLQRWEKGEQIPDGISITKIAKATRVHSHWLLTGREL